MEGRWCGGARPAVAGPAARRGARAQRSAICGDDINRRMNPQDATARPRGRNRSGGNTADTRRYTCEPAPRGMRLGLAVAAARGDAQLRAGLAGCGLGAACIREGRNAFLLGAARRGAAPASPPDA
jgi:hypothetical protein